MKEIRNQLSGRISMKLAYTVYSLIFILFFGISAFRTDEHIPVVAPLTDSKPKNMSAVGELSDLNTNSDILQFERTPQFKSEIGQAANQVLRPIAEEVFSVKALPLSASARFLFYFNGLDGKIIDLSRNDAIAPENDQLMRGEHLSGICDCNGDKSGPVIKLQKEIVLPCGSSFQPSAIGIPSVLDACEEVTLTYHDSEFNPVPPDPGEQIIKRTWYAEDGCHNKSSADQYIYLLDCDVGPGDDYVYAHFDPRYYPSTRRTWRDSGYYFIPELINFQIGLVKQTPTGTVGMKVTFSGNDVSGLRYRGKALFFTEFAGGQDTLFFKRGNIGSATILISEDLLLCPSPAEEIGLGQQDPFFPLQLSGELLSIQGESLPEPIPIRIQLNEFTVR